MNAPYPPFHVIYHRADFDGIFCCEIARAALPPTTVFIGWDYGDPLPQVPFGAQTYMLDISVEGMMDRPNLVWIDHHRSAIDKYNWPIAGYRIDGVAACRLAWQWFFGPLDVKTGGAFPTLDDFRERRVSEPFAVRLAGEYDIWDKRDARAELFQHGLRSMDLSGRWLELLSTTRPSIREIEGLRDVGHEGMIEPDGTIPPAIVWALLENGRVLQYAQTHQNASIIKAAGFDVELEGLKFLACNHARYNSHLFSAGLQPHHDGCLGFNWDGHGRWRISLYGVPGKPDINLSTIAVKFGGGGHKQACGFTCATLPFVLGGAS